MFYARQTRANELVPGPPEGCALLIRTERLNVLDSRTFRCGAAECGTWLMWDLQRVLMDGVP